ncbi:hypothetical protein [Acinetobacter sp.]|uniref:hypothetical protein n=1 Tax=Acinetobacter sp. TaxID=472 RepID=UPI003D05DC77
MSKVQKEKQTAEEITPKKYIILKNANHWELDQPGFEFILSRQRAGEKHFAAYHNIKKEVKAYILRAISLGLLDFTDEPDSYVVSRDLGEPIAKKEPRMRWTESDNSDVKNNKRMPRAPQVSSNTIEIANVNKEAAKLLRFPAHQVVKKIPGAISQMEQKQAIAFVRDLLTIERRGLNPSMEPRRQVMDVIQDQLVKMGVSKIYVSDVVAEEDTSADSDKVTRIPL